MAGTGGGAGPVPPPPNACLTAFIRGYLSKKYMKSFIGIVRFKFSKGDKSLFHRERQNVWFFNDKKEMLLIS